MIYQQGSEFEPKEEVFSTLRDLGSEYGATTGRPRQCNWLNIDRLKRSININGVQSLVVNKMDILRELGRWTVRDSLGVSHFNTEQKFKDYIVDQLPSVEIYFSGSPHGFSSTAYNKDKAVA